jgi:hypothetical protein
MSAMPRHTPSIRLLAGQLRYLFEERPELRYADDEKLRNKLSTEDRYARARQKYPHARDDEIRERVAEFGDRITIEAAREARALSDEWFPGREAAGHHPPQPRQDDTPFWLFAAATGLWAAGLVGWLVNLALYGLSRATWTGGALLALMAIAIWEAVLSHRHSAQQ